MSESGDLVKRAWEDVRYPQQWTRLQHKRMWVNRYGREVSDLELASLCGEPGKVRPR